MRYRAVAWAAAAVAAAATLAWQWRSATPSAADSPVASLPAPVRGVDIVERGPAPRYGVRDAGEVELIVARRATLMDAFDELAALARAGNARAAFQVFEDIERCRALPAKTEALTVLAASARPGREAAAQERAVAELEADARFCEGLDPRAGSFEWLRLAASAGDIEAKARFFAHAFADLEDPRAMLARSEELGPLKRESLRHLLDAGRAGHLGALANLAEQYEHGPLVAPDLAAAYQFARAHEQRSGSLAMREHATRLRAQLTPAQVEAAEARLRHGRDARASP